METTIADEMLSMMGRRLSVHEPAQIFDPHVVGLSFVVRNVEEVDVLWLFDGGYVNGVYVVFLLATVPP